MTVIETQLQDLADGMDWAVGYCMEEGLKFPIKVVFLSADNSRLSFTLIKVARGYDIRDVRGGKKWRPVYPIVVTMTDECWIQQFRVDPDNLPGPGETVH